MAFLRAVTLQGVLPGKRSRSVARGFLWALLAGVLVSCQARANDSVPSSWRKTMSNDPATNIYLGRFAEPMEDATREAGRIVVLSRVLAQGCRGVGVNTAILKAYIARSGLEKLAPSESKAVSDDVGMRFDGIDYEALAHLCAGITYLFGPEGRLVRRLLSAGTGEPRGSYDPLNPYLRVAPLTLHGG